MVHLGQEVDSTSLRDSLSAIETEGIYYFLVQEFFVGSGIASMQLTTSSAGSSISASTTSPVLQVGYTENLTKKTSSFQ